MKRILFLLALLAVGGNAALAVPGSANRVLLIDPSSMPVPAGKATLTIGALQRTNGVYAGDYKLTVSPYFFKSEKGRLAIVVSDASLAQVNEGKTAAIVGTATANGKGGKSRHIDATATPADPDQGQLKLWFMADGRKMTFEPTYHFAGTETATTSKTNLAATLSKNQPTLPLRENAKAKNP